MDTALIKMLLRNFTLEKPAKRAGIREVASAAFTAACD